VRQLGEQFFERVSVVGVVKALVHGLQTQRDEHGRQREIALGVAHKRVEPVIVEHQTSHVPAEHVQYVPERLADQLVRAHHPGQRRVLGTVVEVLGQRARRQHRYLPHARVPRHGSDHVVAHRSQEQI